MAAINITGLNATANAGLQLYLAYRSAGPSPDLILPAAAVYFVALCGIVMNCFVVHCTIKASSLRGTANFLMAYLCLGEVLHQTGHTVFFAVVVSGTNFISLLTATLLLSVMLLASNSNMMALLCAAADRLFAVAAPHKHKEICLTHKCAYLSAHVAVCVAFALYSYYYTLAYAIENPGIPTTACISEILSGHVGNLFFVYTTILNVGCIICYLLIWVLIRCKNGVSKETNTRLLRSLVVIMLISIGGYLINLSVYQFLFAYGDKLGDPIRVWQFGFIAGVLLNVGAAANAPILWLNSTEYRKVFKTELAHLALLAGCCTNVVAPLGTSALFVRNTDHPSKPPPKNSDQPRQQGKGMMPTIS